LQAGGFCRGGAALKEVLRIHVMNDRPANTPGPAEAPSADVEMATRRLMSALDSLESAVERRREADRDEDELASRIQALGADRSRLADELDGSLVKSRKLERANREIAEKLDAAIGTIRAVLGEVTVDASMRESAIGASMSEDVELQAALEEDGLEEDADAEDE
jgi:ABC-type transporter Mla subunit MlaD